MNIGISSIPASPVSQTGSFLVPAPQLDISRYVNSIIIFMESSPFVIIPEIGFANIWKKTPAKNGHGVRT
jgi:hypothetical protein